MSELEAMDELETNRAIQRAQDMRLLCNAQHFAPTETDYVRNSLLAEVLRLQECIDVERGLKTHTEVQLRMIYDLCAGALNIQEPK